MDEVDTKFIEESKKIGLEKSARFAVPRINEVVSLAKALIERENISEDGDKELLDILQKTFEAGFDTALEAFKEDRPKKQPRFINSTSDSDNLPPTV